MIDWDDRANHPPSSAIRPGDTVAGTIMDLHFELDEKGVEKELVWALDDGRKRWANRGLWRAIIAARLQVGDHVRITRGPDQTSNGRTSSTWTIERTPAPMAAPAPAPVHAAAPQMPAW
jgi:hypothetical protein